MRGRCRALRKALVSVGARGGVRLRRPQNIRIRKRNECRRKMRRQRMRIPRSRRKESRNFRPRRSLFGPVTDFVSSLLSGVPERRSSPFSPAGPLWSRTRFPSGGHGAFLQFGTGLLGGAPPSVQDEGLVPPTVGKHAGPRPPDSDGKRGQGQQGYGNRSVTSVPTRAKRRLRPPGRPSGCAFWTPLAKRRPGPLPLGCSQEVSSDKFLSTIGVRPNGRSGASNRTLPCTSARNHCGQRRGPYSFLACFLLL